MTEQQSATRSYRPGEWYAVFGEHVSVLLPASEKSRVAELWERVDVGSGFDELLDALIASGLRSLPGFVLVSTAEEPTRIVLRGSARAVVHLEDDEVIEIDAGAAATWVERAVSGMSSLELVLEDDAPGGSVDREILGGLVRVSRVDQPPRAQRRETPLEVPAAGPVSDPGSGPVTESIAEPVADRADDVLGVVDADVQPAAEAVPDPEPAAGPGFEAPANDLAAEPAWGHSPANPLASHGPAQDPPVWEPPAPRQPPRWGATPAPAPGAETAAPATPAWDPAAGQVGREPDLHDDDHDGHTVAGPIRSDRFAMQHPGIPGQPQAPSVTAQPVARLVFPDGDSIDVDRAVLIGRAPEARRFTSTDQPRLATVPSPNQEISSTHLEVRPGSGADHGSAIVTDMGSTNGTVLTQPGFAPEDLQPGIAVQLLPGALIDLGDGVTILVTNS